jgi:hypothetical protein
MALIDARHESVDTNRSPRAQAASMCKRRYQRMIWVAARDRPCASFLGIGLAKGFSGDTESHRHDTRGDWSASDAAAAG